MQTLIFSQTLCIFGDETEKTSSIALKNTKVQLMENFKNLQKKYVRQNTLGA